MNEQRYGRESAAAGRQVDDRPARPVDDISVVAARADSTPQRTIAPPLAPKNTVPATPLRDEVHPVESGSMSTRSHLRAVERAAGGEAARRDPLGTAVETVSAAVGWTAGYVKSRRASEIRSDAEHFVGASPALALVAALGFGFLVGSFMRR